MGSYILMLIESIIEKETLKVSKKEIKKKIPFLIRDYEINDGELDYYIDLAYENIMRNEIEAFIMEGADGYSKVEIYSTLFAYYHKRNKSLSKLTISVTSNVLTNMINEGKITFDDEDRIKILNNEKKM